MSARSKDKDKDKAGRCLNKVHRKAGTILKHPGACLPGPNSPITSEREIR